MIDIKLDKVSKSYGSTVGIDSIDLDINKGEIFGFIGPNGAGKSTTIRCIMDLINKKSGKIYVHEDEVKRSGYSVREDIGYLPGEIHIYDDLTVEKMFKYSASFYKHDCSKKTEYLVKKLDIDTKKKIDELSLGNLKKVGIVLALMHDPKIVILDEATSGLDPLMQEVFYDLLKEEKKNGKTIFFSSHILSEIKKVCDRVAIIKEGKIIKIEKIEKFTKNNLNNVTIYSKNIENIANEIKQNITEQTDSMIKFVYKENINELIKILSRYNIEKVVIEEPSIEEVFMHYYEKED